MSVMYVWNDDDVVDVVLWVVSCDVSQLSNKFGPNCVCKTYRGFLHRRLADIRNKKAQETQTETNGILILLRCSVSITTLCEIIYFGWRFNLTDHWSLFILVDYFNCRITASKSLLITILFCIQKNHMNEFILIGIDTQWSRHNVSTQICFFWQMIRTQKLLFSLRLWIHKKAREFLVIFFLSGIFELSKTRKAQVAPI